MEVTKYRVRALSEGYVQFTKSELSSETKPMKPFIFTFLEDKIITVDYKIVECVLLLNESK